MGQGAGEVQQELRPSVETRWLHRGPDGRTPGRSKGLGQEAREKGSEALRHSHYLIRRYYILFLWTLIYKVFRSSASGTTSGLIRRESVKVDKQLHVFTDFEYFFQKSCFRVLGCLSLWRRQYWSFLIFRLTAVCLVSLPLSRCPCSPSSSWARWETCWIWSQPWSPAPGTETSDCRGWDTARRSSRWEVKTLCQNVVVKHGVVKGLWHNSHYFYSSLFWIYLFLAVLGLFPRGWCTSYKLFWIKAIPCSTFAKLKFFELQVIV